MNFNIKKLKDWSKYDINFCAYSECNEETFVFFCKCKMVPVEWGLCKEHSELCREYIMELLDDI